MSNFDAKAARAKRPLPLWVDALVRDTALLEPDEFGAYVKILMAMWSSKNLSLPHDPRKLARAGGIGIKTWNKRVWPALEEFFTVENDQVTQKRLSKEAIYVERQVTLQHERKVGKKTDKSLKDNDLGETTDKSTEGSTDTSTDTTIPTTQQPTLDDDDTRATLTDREVLLEAMGHGSQDCTAGGRIIGNQNDMLEASKWVDDLGLTLDEQCAVIRGVVKQATSQILSFKYFSGAMADYAGRKKQRLEPTEMRVIRGGGRAVPEVDQETIIRSAAAGTTNKSQEW